jgi:hypothetical protein
VHAAYETPSCAWHAGLPAARARRLAQAQNYDVADNIDSDSRLGSGGGGLSSAPTTIAPTTGFIRQGRGSGRGLLLLGRVLEAAAGAVPLRRLLQFPLDAADNMNVNEDTTVVAPTTGFNSARRRRGRTAGRVGTGA